MEDLQVQSKNELAGLSVRDLFFKYIRFLPLFIISVALALFVVFVYLRYATLIYRSTGTMVIRDEPSSGSGDKFEQIFASDGKKNIQNEIEFLQSRPLMERVINKLNLNFTYLAKGKIKELNIYNAAPFAMEALQIFDSTSSFSLRFLFTSNNKFRFDGESTEISFGQIFKNEYGIFKMTRKSNDPIANNEYHLVWEPTAAVAANHLANLVIAPKQNTGILVLTMEATNPVLAADVINGLMEVYDKATIEDKNTTTRQTVEFIDARIAEVTRGLDSVTNRKLAFQQANNLISPEAQSTNYLSRLEETDKEVTVQRMQLNTAEMIDDYIRNRRFDATPTPSSLGLEDPTLNELVTGYNKAQLERKSLLENAPPGNVAVKQKDEEIEELRTKISENLGNIKSAYRQSIGSISGKNTSVLSQVKTLPAKHQILIEMEREQQSKLRVFNLLNEKREESAIKIAATISNTKVLTNASADMTPVKPNRRNAQILAALIGLVLPGLFIFIIELLNDKVTTRNDIERITTAPIIAEVGHSYADQNMVVTQNSRSVVAEQFRILRSNLQYILTNITHPVVLITSSFSGEGKSFISTNIGAVMALTGKKTIVLEFDIRKPKILSHLQMQKKPGLTNYLLGKITLEQLPVPVPNHDNLFVLACGPVPPNPSELLLDERLEDVFAWLKENFDVVIIDTAPVGMVSDAMTLSKFANATLYIVRQGHTYKKQIGLIDEFHREGKLPKISLVLNDVKLRSGYGYYGYGRYGYGRGYTSGYFDDEAEMQPTLMRKWFGWLDTKTWKKKKAKRGTV